MVQVLFALYLLSMLMPFLVTMIPAFLLMQKLGLIGKFAAVILPKTFAVFGVFFFEADHFRRAGFHFGGSQTGRVR